MSLAFEDQEFDERGYQRELVAHLETTHSEITCSKTKICELFPRMVSHAEAPVLRTPPTPPLLLSSLVREPNHKVGRTGAGSHGGCGGYDTPRGWVCDLEPDCSDGSDEAGCADYDCP